MTRSTLLMAVFSATALCIGCGQSASVDEANLSGSEAAAMVAEETQATAVAFNAEVRRPSPSTCPT